MKKRQVRASRYYCPRRKKGPLYWVPRGMMVLFIIFLSLFAFDAFSENPDRGEAMVAFAIHMIPSILLIALLLVAWKWEGIGGTLIVIMGIVFTFFFDTYESMMSFLIVSVPVLVVGILFMLDYHCNVKPKLVNK